MIASLVSYGRSFYCYGSSCGLIEVLVQTNFLGIQFSGGTLDDVRQKLAEFARSGGFRYVVTPNVDNVISYHDKTYPRMREVYDHAGLVLCDSRVLAILARLVGKVLHPCPGADLVPSLLEAPAFPGCRIAVMGPPSEDITLLEERFPETEIRYIDAPSNLIIDSPEWKDCIERALNLEWDFLFLCISFPKQENIAYELLRRGRQSGTAFCVGASIDFITGRQVRAPLIMRRLSLEWLYRLFSDPKRMWKRYIIKGPQIIPILLGWR